MSVHEFKPPKDESVTRIVDHLFRDMPKSIIALAPDEDGEWQLYPSDDLQKSEIVWALFAAATHITLADTEGG